ncbi:hypothetical protein B0H14DRAFT_3888751 [Mycena olivaceomarginata]|nr:hypothetical protein B0H14DRAFT_3888751 [Mycena olivaceomarginata]
MPLIDPFSSLTAALSTAHLIPDVLPASFAPTALLTILLPSGPVAPGTPKEEDVGEDGLVKNFGADGPKYTLAMFDPDAPRRSRRITGLTPNPDPTFARCAGQAHARFGADAISPSGSAEGQRAASVYIHPLPRATSFTLSEDAPEHDATPAGRRHWDAVKFGERNGLELLGVGWYLFLKVKHHAARLLSSSSAHTTTPTAPILFFLTIEPTQPARPRLATRSTEEGRYRRTEVGSYRLDSGVDRAYFA